MAIIFLATAAYRLTVLFTGKWLNDKHILAAQFLMRSDPGLLKVDGLQDTVLAQNMSFKATRGEMVQILHSGGNHWLTVSNVGAETDAIRVYDSLGTTLPFDTKKQIACLLKTESQTISIEYANVQVNWYACYGSSVCIIMNNCSL